MASLLETAVLERSPPLWVLAGAGVVLGATLPWAQAPYSFYPLLLVVLPLAGLLFDLAKTPWRAAIVGWTLGFGYFLPGLLWIGEAFFVEADRFAWMAPLAVTLLPAVLSLYWAAAFAAGRALGGSVWAVSFCWAGAEFVRSEAFTGFPWGLFAYAWVDAPIGQAAAWVGPFGLNLLTIFAGLALGRALVGRDLGGAAWPHRAAFGVGAAALVTAGWLGGVARTPVDSPAPAPDAPLLRIVQPNVPQTEKWAQQYLQRNFDRLMLLSETASEARRRAGMLTAAELDAPSPDVIIWPETAVTPWVISEDTPRRDLMARLGSAHLVVGTQRLQVSETGGEQRRDVFNSLFVLTPEGDVAVTYDKHHLVPFGEFLPFQDWLEAMGVFQLAGGRGGFASGPGPQVVSAPGVPSFVALICYEAIFPNEMPTALGAARPDVIIQITNDAWFGESGGPHQHLAQARMRAIEQGLPFLRSANTGISAAIDAYGRVTHRLELNTQGRIDLHLPPRAPETVYARWGDGVFLGLMALFAGLTAAAFFEARRSV